MDFHTAMNQGMHIAEATWGERFTLDGDSKEYIGTFNSWTSAQTLAPGGYEEQIDGIMVASKDQFATPPLNGQRMTLNGRRYVIVQPEEDLVSWTLALKGINQ